MTRDWYTWEEVRAELDLDEEAVARHKERMIAKCRAYRLAELRAAHGLTQQDIAETMGVGQSQVSRIEHGELGRSDEMDRLRAYVAALGGTIEVVAKVGDERLVLG